MAATDLTVLALAGIGLRHKKVGTDPFSSPPKTKKTLKENLGFISVMHYFFPFVSYFEGAQ